MAEMHDMYTLETETPIFTPSGEAKDEGNDGEAVPIQQD
jgi:hypothetical protein